MLRLALVTLLCALALAPTVGAAERAAQRDYMVHMDFSGATPAFIPDNMTIVPGGVVQLMLFGSTSAHSLTLDVTGFDAEVLPGPEAQRVAQFNAPTTPGTYPFHDKHSAAKGTLVVVGDAATVGVRENGYDLHFDPERLTVAAGTTVTFRANGTFAHTLTSDDGGIDVAIEPGGEETFVAPTTPGEYAFYCKYHKDGGMIGVLVVTQANTPPTPPGEAVPTRSTPIPGMWLLAASLALAAALRRAIAPRR